MNHGDVVRHKSGGPLMLVESVHLERARVAWIDERGLVYRSEFNVTSLRLRILWQWLASRQFVRFHKSFWSKLFPN
jgi:uncharacterized protein YodC (DUF2158 family)